MERSPLVDVVTGRRVSKAEYEAREPELRTALVNTQYDVTQQRDFAVLVVLAGMGGSGRSETANRLSEWMDPRHVHLRAVEAPVPAGHRTIPLWRYGCALPPKGSIGVMLDAWYQQIVMQAAENNAAPSALAMADIREFEAMLVREGVVLLKFWFHLDEGEQAERLRLLSARKVTSWRVTDEDRWQLKHYGAFSVAAEQVLQMTNTDLAPWTVINGCDPEYRELAVGNALLEAMQHRLGAAPNLAAPVALAPLADADVLRRVDLSQRVAKEDYEQELDALQAALARQTRRKRFRKRSLVVVFEGVDAAGKGSTIRRVTHALDARQYSVVPVAAPSEEERRYPWLWRFWRELPRRGRITIYDRSWYGRVLVERVEGLSASADWQRAYEEINGFERELVVDDAIVLKFWLQISKREQLKRFREREESPFKRFKLTPEDWRNRRKWTAYQEAAAEMIARTSTQAAPWTVVEAEDKSYARLKVLRTLVEALKRTG